MVRRFGEGGEKQSCPLQASTQGRRSIVPCSPGRYKKELPGDEKVREIQKGKADLVVSINISIKEMQEAELEEKDAQGDYEQFTREAAKKSVQDSKSITEKDGAKAEAEVNLVKETNDDDISIREGGDEKAAKTKQKFGKPVTFCENSRRWRDARGRYCRPPSPAAPASFARSCAVHF